MNFGPTGGTLISVLFSAQLIEKFGRRFPICGGSLIIILGSILQAAAVNYGMVRNNLGRSLCIKHSLIYDLDSLWPLDF